MDTLELAEELQANEDLGQCTSVIDHVSRKGRGPLGAMVATP